MKEFDPITYVEDDGQTTPEIGLWGIKKYRLFGAYCNIFTTGMKYKWKQRVYIDLFAGAGCARIRKENKIVHTSALIAAKVPDKFTKYIICEEKEENFHALKNRFINENCDLNCEFIFGDSNKNVEKIINAIPADGTLSFCFVDPFSLNIEFETIRKIAATRKVDFLILLALQMDANRNLVYYIDEESDKIDKFIGNKNWREPFLNAEVSKKDFIKYLAEAYDNNMRSIGYKVNPNLKFKIENTVNTPIYYLAFYSKSDVGNDFYTKVEKMQNNQGKLF
ncbi:MAG: three-Cys-motif partner protein TcmP [Taibaiella sp.]|nr:three-Cys-motif partner protein TcmP [Taibaiella sp.]